MHLAFPLLPSLPRSWFSAWRRVVHSAAVLRPAAVSGTSRSAHELGKGSTLTVLQPQGAIMTCLEGCVWITQDGDRRDVVIEAGQTFCADRSSRALIHAIEASRVGVVPVV